MAAKAKEYVYLILLALFALLICLSSPLHPFAQAYPDTDSSVFLLMGRQMSNGMIPYADMFDHKGPLIYVLNWLGLSIGNFTGVWVIELTCMLLSLVLCYKTAKRFFSETVAFLGTTVTFVTIFSWLDGGNYAESWALPLLFGGLYCLTGYFVQDFELNKKQVLIAGFCMGGVLMLKMTMIGLWVGMCSTILLHSIIIRKSRLILRYMCLFVVGTVTAILPFIIWLGMKDALYEFFECYILFNINYGDISLIGAFYKVLEVLTEPIVMVVTIIIIVSVFFNEQNVRSTQCLLAWASALMFVATVFLASMNSYNYVHFYYLTLFPCMILPLAWAINRFCNNSYQKQYATLAVIAVCLIISSNSLRNVNNAIDKAFSPTKSKNAELTSFIKENIEKEEPILYVGNYCDAYLMSENPPSGRYPYIFLQESFWPPHVLAFVLEDYINEIEANKPLWVIYGNEELPEIIADYIEEHYTIMAYVGERTLCLRSET